MIEVGFSDAACGNLKRAQSFGEGAYQNVEGCVFISHPDGSKVEEAEIEEAKKNMERRERRAWEKAVPLGGKVSDIFSFHLILSIGDISESIPEVQRKKVMEHLYSVHPQIEIDSMVSSLVKQAQDELKTVQKRLAMGESMRIWYSSHPDELCGFYWFME